MKPFLLAAALFFAPAIAAAASGDDSFLAAREAVRLGDRARLERIAPEVKGHDLEAYVDYWQLLVRLKETDAATLRDFLSRNDKTYVAERLRSDWLKLLGRQQQWLEFDAEYGKLQQPDQEVACYALQSRRAGGDATAADQALALWLNLGEVPDSCVPVFEALIYDKRILADEVWARVHRLFESNKLSWAKQAMFYLPPSQTPEAKQVDALLDKPMPYLARLSASWSATRLGHELAVLAVQRVARTDPKIAAERLQALESKLSPSERGWAWSQVGWQAALRHLPEAAEWYRNAGDVALSDEVAAWKIRAALRTQDWGTVRATIEKMPPAFNAQPDWTYWLGRAYKAGGRLEEANALFAKIAGQPNFYGNLADDELNRPTMPPPKAKAPSKEELAQAAANPGVLRSLALFRLGLRFEGTKEWNWSLRAMDDRELLAAAEIARKNDILDRAIAAADKTKNEHDYSVRYLAPFSDQVRPAARHESLDDAWVYGLMRQESRFITTAKSTVGASGLMQLMPATAKWVAKKIGLKSYNHGKVNDTDTNLLLGTTYMRLVMESLDNHPVLASAAYNAGPGRARRWRAERPLEGAIYAETIPFSETRDYVKKVMSNSVYYSALFDGKPQSLKLRLGMIPARTGAEAPKGEDLP